MVTTIVIIETGWWFPSAIRIAMCYTHAWRRSHQSYIAHSYQHGKKKSIHSFASVIIWEILPHSHCCCNSCNSCCCCYYCWLLFIVVAIIVVVVDMAGEWLSCWVVSAPGPLDWTRAPHTAASEAGSPPFWRGSRLLRSPPPAAGLLRYDTRKWELSGPPKTDTQLVISHI